MVISGIEIFFGEECCTHDNLRKNIGQEIADRIVEKSGFEQRHVTKAESDILDIAKHATYLPIVNDKLKSADFVVVVSEYVQRIVPPPSAWILSDQISDNQLVIDLNRGCSGFCEALVLAQHLFAGGEMKKAVIITAENYSKIIHRTNRTLAPIFSDAVAFTFLEFCPDHVFHSKHGFDHSRSSDLMYNMQQSELFMNGAGLVSFVKSKVIPSIEELITQKNSGESIHHFFAHQGSQLVIDSVNQQLAGKLPEAAFLSRRIGNINASSIPYAMKCTLGADGQSNPMRTLLSGFGVGLSYCNVLLDLVYTHDNR